ncbi:unnamed protein product [Closterium sp. Naga37s-1]|nr:unnamed protein product [Closterium sp. Naga37s-1]CAI5492937.1 unnamed protein product [Closterium sp. Naga37s-1]
MSCLHDPHGAFSWADGPLGSGSPSFFASDLVAAHRPSPFALLAPFPMCADSRAALASSSWNGAAAQPNHSAALPVRAPESSARVPAWGAASGGALTHSQPLLAAAASATAELWGGNETAHAQARSALNGLCSPAHSWREAAEACHTHSPSRRGGAAAASATGGADESASRAAAASAGGGQGACGCTAVEREDARRTPSDRGKLRRSLTAGAAMLAGGGEETGDRADLGAWRAVSGAGGSQATTSALTSSRHLQSCVSAAAAPLETGEEGEEGWMWEYQGCCEHSSWNYSSAAAHSPETHRHSRSTARTTSSSFFSPSHHSFSPAHDLLPSPASTHLSALHPWCAAVSRAPCCAVRSSAAATGGAVCAAAGWTPWNHGAPPSTPATPALPPIPVAPPSTAPPPPSTPSPAQLQQAFPCAAVKAVVKGAVGDEGKTGRWWARLTRPWWRQHTDGRRRAGRARTLCELLTCWVLSS